MKKNIKLLILSFVGAISFTSCDNANFEEDYNKNTNGIYSSDYKSLMTGAIAQFSLRGGQAFYMRPVLYAQYQSQVVYTTESQYANDAGQWDWYYARALNNLDKIIEDYSGSVDNVMLSQGSKGNMIGVSKIFRAIIYKRLTDTYGDIPYSEANKIANGVKTPKFDKQEDIYKSLINELKAGRDLLEPSAQKPLGDFLYEGNVKNWAKLANSVILQASLQLSKKYPTSTGYAATEFKNALVNSYGVIEEVANEPWFNWSAAAGVTNPLYAFRAADYRLSAEIVSSLKGDGSVFNRTSNHTYDYRINVYSSSASLAGLPYGYNSTDLAAAGFTTSTKAQINSKFRAQTGPMNLMTAAYTFLNRAEAASRGWTTENAETLLTQAITLNYATLDSHYSTAISANAASYAAARVADMTTFGALRVIGEEKWATLFNNGFDAWAEWRRTGYPSLKPAPSAFNGGVIPRRVPYPSTEMNFNATNYKDAVSRLLPAEDKNTSKVWWDQ